MQVVWAGEEAPESFSKAIFLAGPTPRSEDVSSWRPDAIETLESLGYDGVVFIPESRGHGWHRSYDHQVDWEAMALAMADVIVFWVPRDLETMPAFTTNVEWGMWFDSGKVVLGAPEKAPKMRYLQRYASQNRVPQSTTLRGTLQEALKKLGDGALRQKGEREVPLFIWNYKTFQQWYGAQVDAGHILNGAQLLWHQSGRRGRPFCWVLRVQVYLPQEKRSKNGEFALMRLPTASVLAYQRGETLRTCKIVLVKEFRSAVSNADGYVWELPGGSSFDDEMSMDVCAIEELEEETGLRVEMERLQALDVRQTYATMLSHQAALYTVELTDEEMALVQSREGEVFGAHDSERCMVYVCEVGEILDAELVDWTNVGMILRALVEEA